MSNFLCNHQIIRKQSPLLSVFKYRSSATQLLKGDVANSSIGAWNFVGGLSYWYKLFCQGVSLIVEFSFPFFAPSVFGSALVCRRMQFFKAYTQRTFKSGHFLNLYFALPFPVCLCGISTPVFHFSPFVKHELMNRFFSLYFMESWAMSQPQKCIITQKHSAYTPQHIL